MLLWLVPALTRAQEHAEALPCSQCETYYHVFEDLYFNYAFLKGDGLVSIASPAYDSLKAYTSFYKQVPKHTVTDAVDGEEQFIVNKPCPEIQNRKVLLDAKGNVVTHRYMDGNTNGAVVLYEYDKLNTRVKTTMGQLVNKKMENVTIENSTPAYEGGKLKREVLVSLSSFGADTQYINYTYNANGKIVVKETVKPRMSAPNRDSVIYTYNSSGLPLSRIHRSHGHTEMEANFAYDEKNRLASLLVNSIWYELDLKYEFKYNNNGLSQFIVINNKNKSIAPVVTDLSLNAKGLINTATMHHPQFDCVYTFKYE